MNAKPENEQQWDPCIPGEIERMVQRIKIRQRRQALRRLGGTAALVLAAGAGGYVAVRWMQQPTEYYFGGIACRDVRRLLPEYHAERLRAALMRQITIHLAKCPSCGPAYQRMIASMGGTA